MPKHNESSASKKDVNGKENTKEKKNNIEGTKWLQIHKKKCFTSVYLKKNYNQQNQTKNLTKVNDQFLSTVTWWLKIYGIG